MALNHHNMEYYNAGLTNYIPRMTGDRYYAQDAVRDFWFNMGIAGLVLRDLQGSQTKVIVDGGLVTQNATNKVDISAFIGYAPFAVSVMDSFAASPPTVKSEDLPHARIAFSGLTAVSVSTATWGSANYLKVAYAETDGSTRVRAKKAGTYAYEKVPGYVITCNTTPATAYEICLAVLTSANAGVTITVSYVGRTTSVAVKVNNAGFKSMNALSPASTVNVDWNVSSVASLAVNQNTVLTFANPTLGYSMLLVTHDGSSRTLTFPTCYFFGTTGTSAYVSTLDAGATMKTMFTIFYDGSNYYVQDTAFHA